MISFFKYHGTGNDFILIDDRKNNYTLSKEIIFRLCDRHFGIGADGLILLRNHSQFDFEMLYYNSDGLPGSMCGNGGRCCVAFAHSLGMIKEHTRFTAFDGPHEAKILSVTPYIVRLHMNDVHDIETGNDFIFLNTGSPHYVIFAEHVNKMDVVTDGRKIRYSDRFRNAGTNVNFVEVRNQEIFVRTYERGVEDETLSCGTGVTASVLAASTRSAEIISGTRVLTPGGMLKVYFQKKDGGFSDVWLEGNAEPVFKGEIKLDSGII